jgi:hypothetical protein
MITLTQPYEMTHLFANSLGEVIIALTVRWNDTSLTQFEFGRFATQEQAVTQAQRYTAVFSDLPKTLDKIKNVYQDYGIPYTLPELTEDYDIVFGDNIPAEVVTKVTKIMRAVAQEVTP